MATYPHITRSKSSSLLNIKPKSKPLHLIGNNCPKTLKSTAILASPWTKLQHRAGTSSTGSRRMNLITTSRKCTFWNNLHSVTVNSLKWLGSLKELTAVIKMVNASVMALTLGAAIMISSAPVIFNFMLRMNQRKRPFYVNMMKGTCVRVLLVVIRLLLSWLGLFVHCSVL